MKQRLLLEVSVESDEGTAEQFRYAVEYLLTKNLHRWTPDVRFDWRTLNVLVLEHEIVQTPM
jgi:hypothetical protein